MSQNFCENDDLPTPYGQHNWPKFLFLFVNFTGGHNLFKDSFYKSLWISVTRVETSKKEV